MQGWQNQEDRGGILAIMYLKATSVQSKHLVLLIPPPTQPQILRPSTSSVMHYKYQLKNIMLFS